MSPGVAGRTDVPARAVRPVGGQAAHRPDLRRGPRRGLRQPGKIQRDARPPPRPHPPTASSTSAGCCPPPGNPRGAATISARIRILPMTLRTALDKDFNAGRVRAVLEGLERVAEDASTPTVPRPAPPRCSRGLRDVLPLPLQNLWNDEQPGAAWLATRINDAVLCQTPAGDDHRAQRAHRPGGNPQHRAAPLPRDGHRSAPASGWASSPWRCWPCTAGGAAGSC